MFKNLGLIGSLFMILLSLNASSKENKFISDFVSMQNNQTVLSQITSDSVTNSQKNINNVVDDLPYFINFENEVVDALPEDWTSDVNSGDTFSSVTVYATSGVNNTKALQIFYGTGPGEYVAAITKTFNSLENKRVRFYAKSIYDNGSSISVGTCNSQTGDINYSECEAISVTGDMTQYIVDLDANTTDNCVYIKLISNMSGEGVYIDNLFIEEVPVGPSISSWFPELEFCSIPSGRTGVVNINIENWGTGDLTGNFDDNSEVFSFEPNTFNISEGEKQIVIVTMTPPNDAPLGEYTDTFQINSNDTQNTIYEINCSTEIVAAIDDNISIIGTGRCTNLSLPMEPFYENSWSQSLYYANEISIFDQRIESIAWQFNQNAEWGPEELKIYLYETDDIDINDWIPVSELTPVYDGVINTANADENGWIKFDLNTQYIYSGEHNLIIATSHSTPHSHSFRDEFYGTITNCTDRSIEIHDSEPIDFENIQAGSAKQYIPNIMFTFADIPHISELTVTPTSLDFGRVNIDTESNPMIVNLLSTGTDDVVIEEAPVISGINADQFTIIDSNTYPLTIPANESSFFSVKFIPNVAGDLESTISITDNSIEDFYITNTRVNHVINLTGFSFIPDNNETPETATDLTLPLNDYPAAIDPIGDIDWYKISALEIGDSLTIYTTRPADSSIDSKAWLYGPCVNADSVANSEIVKVDDNSNGDDQPSINHTITTPGDYYIRIAYCYNYPVNSTKNKDVYRDMRTNCGSYNLNIDVTYHYDYNAPQNLQANNFTDFIYLSWEEPPYERALASYDVYRNDIKITDTPIVIGTEFYIDSDVILDTEYNYYVVANYSTPDGISPQSNSVTITYINSGDAIFKDSFENYQDFNNDFGDVNHEWILNDADGENTFGISGVDYEHYGEPVAYMVFNPANTTPPMTETSVTPQDGEKYIISFSPESGNNDDWLITPKIHCGNVTILSFYAKSFSSEYNNEKFELKFSVGGEEPTDFAYNVDNANPVFTVSNEWTLYNFNVSSLTAQTVVRFGLHCVSQDAFALMIDNFRIDGSDDIVDNEEVEEIIPQTTALKNNYPNPFNPETTISYDMPKSGHVKIDVYNIKGQKVKTIVNENVQAGTHTVVWNGKNENNSRVSSGIYFYQMTADSYSSLKKMMLMK